MQRRDFLSLSALGGGAVFASGLAGCASAPGGAVQDDFYFVQLSDVHWGFQGPPNPDASGTLRKAVAAVNALDKPPEFVVFTGDLTHTTDDPVERRRRLAEFKSIVADLKVGRHDLLKMRMPDYAYPARESPVHNERCTPGSGTGAAETGGGNPDIGASPPRSLRDRHSKGSAP